MELMMNEGIDGDFLLGEGGDFALDESCCCDVACETCATNAPDTLFARFSLNPAPTDGSDCSCVDTIVIPLTKTYPLSEDPDAEDSLICNALGEGDHGTLPIWSGSGEFCGYEICLCLRPCEAGIHGGGPCEVGEVDNTWRLLMALDCDGGTVQTGAFADLVHDCASGGCDPLTLHFEGDGAAFLTLICGTIDPAANWGVLITET